MVAVKMSKRSALQSDVHSLEDPQKEAQILFQLHKNAPSESPEARLLRPIFHPLQSRSQQDNDGRKYIVTIYHAGHVSKYKYICMEYCSNGELYTRVKDKAITPAQVKKYFRQIALALYQCHKQSVYHCDVSLENILLDAQDDCKLVDFGLALSPDRIGKGARGKKPYMAPEVGTRLSSYS